jgi:hypothetical protein
VFWEEIREDEEDAYECILYSRDREDEEEAGWWCD